MDAKSAHILAVQSASLTRLVGELDRLLEDSDTWRALTALESVGMAAGGVDSYAWKARHEELQSTLAALPAAQFKSHLLAALAALPVDDPALVEATEAWRAPPSWASPLGTDRRESIALRIATLQPMHRSSGAEEANQVAKLSVVPSQPDAVNSIALDLETDDDQVLAAVASSLRNEPLKTPHVATEKQSEVEPSCSIERAAQSIVAALAPAAPLATPASEDEECAKAAAEGPAEVVPTNVTQIVSESSLTTSAPPADWDIHPVEIASLEVGWDPDFEEEEAEVVVVTKQSMTTEKLEERLARMDRDSAGLLKNQRRTSPATAALPLRSLLGRLETVVRKATAADRPIEPLKRNDIGKKSSASSADAKSGDLGSEARVEIVRRLPSDQPSGTSAAPGNTAAQASPTPASAITLPERRPRAAYQPSRAEPIAAFVASSEEASVEIVRPDQPAPWRPTVHRELEPVPVSRFLKALNNG